MLLTVDLGRTDVRPGDLLLDAGCGEGRHCVGALDRGARVVGLDIDRSALYAAQATLRDRPGAQISCEATHSPFRFSTRPLTA